MRAGQVAVFTSGEYSDFNIVEILRATVDISFAGARQSYAAETGCDSYRGNDTAPEFLAWLKRLGWLEECKDAVVVHLGDYGRFELYEYTPK